MLQRNERQKKNKIQNKLGNSPAANDLKVVFDTLVVDILVLLKVGHSNLLVGPVRSSLGVGASGDIDSRGNDLIENENELFYKGFFLYTKCCKGDPQWFLTLAAFMNVFDDNMMSGEDVGREVGL